jgi:hypothetical protein
MSRSRHLDREVARLQKLAALNPDKFDMSPVRLLEDYGFVNEYRAVYQQRAGTIITNPIEITILRERGARLENV